MAKEYKTLTFDDSENGRKEAEKKVNFYAHYGWQIKSKETVQQGYSFGKTCCWGIVFLPLALLGKKSNTIQIILEREISPENKKLDEEMAKAELEQMPVSKPMSTSNKLLWIGILIGGAGVSAIINNQTSPAKVAQQQNDTPSATQQPMRRIPYLVQSNDSLKYIILDPKYVNKNDLRALGQELRNDYSSSSFVNLSVYDDTKAVDIRSYVINGQSTQAIADFYDAHYVAQYNKNDNTSYNAFAIYQDGSGKKVNKIIDY